jgi:pyruvate-formate lyase-activating enzyme
MDEDIVNYKKTSMFIATCYCDFKCCTELGLDICICQNSPIAQSKVIDMSNEKIVKRYMKNKLTHAIVFGGLEPFKQFDEMMELIKCFREQTEDDIVIFTGYNPSEISEEIEQLRKFKNIIVKFGRYMPGHEVHLDVVLGVNLASDNQYAMKIS